VLDKFPKYHMSILLGDFIDRVGKEDIFKPRIGHESLHYIIRIVNVATSKNLTVKSAMFPHCNINKYTWKSPDENTPNYIDHILVDRRWNSCVIDVRSFRAADCKI
jgi:hypothetical protein